MIKLTIQDSRDVMSFEADLVVPITATPIINATDVETIDGNISTYYSSTKRQLTFNLGHLDQETYASVKGFVDRQYSNLHYPQITVEGAETVNVAGITAKMTLNEESIINSCGLVEGVTVTFRESKQMA